MNRSQKIFLSFVCALALVLIPLSYGWAQSSTTQQDQVVTPESNLNQEQQQEQQPVNESTERSQEDLNQNNTDQNRDINSQDQSVTREKPSEPSATPAQNQNENRDNSNTRSSSDQASDNREGLPATAGELPLLALIGALSLAGAAGTRVLGRARSR